MNRSHFLLGALVVAAAVLVSCIRVPEIPFKEAKEAIQGPNSSTPVGREGSDGNTGLDHEVSAPAVPAVDPAKGVQAARAVVAAARKVYTDSVARTARLRADLKAKEDAAKEVERQAIADRIVRDGWWVFGAGLIGAIIGIVGVARNYGLGGWWVVLGGAGVAVLGLAMVWLGPSWLLIVRVSVGVVVAASVCGAGYAYWRRKRSA